MLHFGAIGCKNNPFIYISQQSCNKIVLFSYKMFAFCVLSIAKGYSERTCTMCEISYICAQK